MQPYGKTFLMQDLKIVTRFFSETPRLVVIGNGCLKPFCAAVRRALIASTQLLDSPITSPRQRNSLKSWNSFERVFFDIYSGTIQIVAFTFTLSASKYIFFRNQSLLPRQSIGFAPTSSQDKPQGHSAFVVGFWSPISESSVLTFPTFIFRLQESTDDSRSSKLLLVMTRSSAYIRPQFVYTLSIVRLMANMSMSRAVIIYYF